MYDESNYRIKASDVLAQTNGGLDVILYYYPQAQDVVDKKKSHFKAHPEKTASARCTLTDSGAWVVTDFGDDQTPRNAIEIVRKEEKGCSQFKDALEFIVNKWNLKIEGHTNRSAKADISKKPADKGLIDGTFIPEIRKDDAGKPLFSELELEVLGPFITPEDCLALNFYPLKAYHRIKDREDICISSREDYPIFMIDEGEFKKIYQPLSPDKAFRFSYAGTRPKEYVFGLDYIRKAYQEGVEAWENEYSDQPPEKQPAPYKIPQIFLCMGDRDALNVFSLDKDYYVIWLNSESQTLSGKVYSELMNMTDHLYQVPDLDATGVKHGIKQALKYLDLKTIWLPKQLQHFRDFRGNKCKDVTDFVKRWNPDRVRREFKGLIYTAMHARFWDILMISKGEKEYPKLKFNPEYFFYFLNLSGIYHFPIKADKDIFIRIENHIVSEIEVLARIKKEVKNFLRQRKEGVDVLNLVNTTPYMSEASLGGLSYPEESYIPRDLNFKDNGYDHQLLFFEDKVWKITKDEITESKTDEYTNVVWAEKVITRKVKQLPDFFKVTTRQFENGEREYDIVIPGDPSLKGGTQGGNKQHSCLYLNYLIQTSRIHWRKELEVKLDDMPEEEAAAYREKYKFAIDGPNLDEEEIYEQKMHLINKIYALGYLMHRYKDSSRQWAVFTMDNRESSTGESFGGTGKSLYMQSPTHFMKWEYLNGKNKKLTQNPHVFENITEHTDYVLVDDADQYFDFDFFYNAITGHTEVNPKGTKSTKIPYDKSPKFGFSTNHTLRKNDEATQRRVLYTVFSDYFHENESGEYRESRTPLTDIGQRLFDDFDDEEWNRFINFMAQCVKFYLGHSKINPPMGNVRKRSLRALATEGFMNWADFYFLGDGESDTSKLDQEVSKDDAFKDYIDKSNSTKPTMNTFTARIKAWCSYHEFVLNPEDRCNSGNGAKKNRIISKNELGKTIEMIYIDSRGISAESPTKPAEASAQAGNRNEF